MMVLAVLMLLVALLLRLSYKMQDQDLKVLAVSAVIAVSVMTATPPWKVKFNPHVPQGRTAQTQPEIFSQKVLHMMSHHP